jgi:hypothetical protein
VRRPGCWIYTGFWAAGVEVLCFQLPLVFRPGFDELAGLGIWYLSIAAATNTLAGFGLLSENLRTSSGHIEQRREPDVFGPEHGWPQVDPGRRAVVHLPDAQPATCRPPAGAGRVVSAEGLGGVLPRAGLLQRAH